MKSKQLAQWDKFYRDVFGIIPDFSGLKIPQEKRPGFERLIVVVPGMTTDFLLWKCREMFPIRKEVEGRVISDRTAEKKAYAVWARNDRETDGALKDLSAAAIKEKKISAITLDEYLLYELMFFHENKDLLDKKGITLCAGSRFSSIEVPIVFSLLGKVYVDSCLIGKVDPKICGRKVVA